MNKIIACPHCRGDIFSLIKENKEVSFETILITASPSVEGSTKKEYLCLLCGASFEVELEIGVKTISLLRAPTGSKGMINE